MTAELFGNRLFSLQTSTPDSFFEQASLPSETYRADDFLNQTPLQYVKMVRNALAIYMTAWEVLNAGIRLCVQQVRQSFFSIFFIQRT